MVMKEGVGTLELDRTLRPSLRPSFPPSLPWAVEKLMLRQGESPLLLCARFPLAFGRHATLRDRGREGGREGGRGVP